MMQSTWMLGQTKKVSAGELNNGRRTRNKNLNSENLKIYRGKKNF